eukprot:7171589-Pyramimonas_sp.AAC.1
MRASTLGQPVLRPAGRSEVGTSTPHHPPTPSWTPTVQARPHGTSHKKPNPGAPGRPWIGGAGTPRAPSQDPRHPRHPGHPGGK